MTSVWAAATGLGNHHITNNVAVFVGLQRMLAHAWEKEWTKLHVVGESALVLGMMSQRRRPKATTLVHWYQITRRLADLCEVVSWTHHYRRHNKAAGWLANLAIDRG
ncbi:reverse transcriptase [Phytophthora megakarya]|uniref:Reverse transcriptase n=1 Tax=Phytophthora megakarya TaxID=4795 RepID=A0A225UNK3_9STRA|nr:reverse transcriptase [Phytophthora megakarya]